MLLATSADAQQWRGRDHGGYRHHGGHYRSYDRGYRRHNGFGGDLAVGIIGLAAGAIIAGALSAPEPPRRYIRANGDGNWIAYCARRYRSYDANSNSFVGNDGYRHQCR